MKFITIIISLLFLSGCFGHWKEPSSKLASQANNYLDNERNTFFYRYCYLYGDALVCLTEMDNLTDCEEQIYKANHYRKSNFENAKRFISPDTGDLSKVRINSRPPKTEREAIDRLKEGFKYTIETFTEHEFPQCSEIAYGS